MRQRCLRYCATTHFICRDAGLPTDRKVSKLLGLFKENGGETDDLSAKEKLSLMLEERKIMIKDIRGLEKSFDFNKNGFVVKLDSKMSYEDFNDSKMIRNVYCKEIEIRRSHTEFPFTPDTIVSTYATDYPGVITAKAKANDGSPPTLDEIASKIHGGADRIPKCRKAYVKHGDGGVLLLN
ncbi:hypothetical protein OEA41_003827 [Lepraria neglecta]|uniref:Uncharacterized protein n=1 Tax=Lepraria neglecta TaxID=209136 RepID=A0AAD9Z956_9LECA|nr:hypothetical protein OEA41_003827 [Lepraria neglecta]